MEIVCRSEAYRRFESSSLRQREKHAFRVCFFLCVDMRLRNSVFSEVRASAVRKRIVVSTARLSAARHFVAQQQNIFSAPKEKAVSC